MKSCCKDAFNEEEEERSQKDKAKGLQKLQEKWKVRSIGQVVLILCTFAIGGSACGLMGRQIMHHIGPDHKVLWILVYVLLITVLWPICVLLISIPLGQFNFFRHYLKRMGMRISGKK
jgi:hypothetical protein